MSIPTALRVPFSFLLSPINFHRCSSLFPTSLFFPLALRCCFFCQFRTYFTFRGVPLVPCLWFSSLCLPFSFSSRCIFSRIPPVKASLHPSDSHFVWLPSSLPHARSHAQPFCLRRRSHGVPGIHSAASACSLVCCQALLQPDTIRHSVGPCKSLDFEV